VRDLDVNIGSVRVAAGLGFELAAGERLAILGRNGTGKTTLLNTLAGLRETESGSIAVCGASYETLGARRAAQLRGLLPQGHIDAFQSTVLETALIGRHPHVGRWAWEGKEDERFAREALAAVDLAGLGGARCTRYPAASASAWPSPPCWPSSRGCTCSTSRSPTSTSTTRSPCSSCFRGAPARTGVGIVMVLHDINLALRHADRALLLFGEGRTLEGPVESVLTAEALSRLYGHPLREMRDGAARYFIPG
jgi:iron complex transport system ATP-binding protein